MNKFIKIITGIGIPLVGTFMGVEWDTLSNASRGMSVILMIIFSVCTYLAGENEKYEAVNQSLQTDKDELGNKIIDNQRNYEDKYQQLKDEHNRIIEGLNNKISLLAIQLNGNCPYTIQTYIKATNMVLRKGTYYEVEVMISSTSKEFDLKYINITFNEPVSIQQNGYHKATGVVLKSQAAIFRCGAYEYSFVNNNSKECIETKCSFRIMYNQVGLLTMTAEVINSDNNTTGKKIKELNFE